MAKRGETFTRLVLPLLIVGVGSAILYALGGKSRKKINDRASPKTKGTTNGQGSKAAEAEVSQSPKKGEKGTELLDSAPCDDCVTCNLEEDMPLAGSMDPYLCHVIICSGTQDYQMSHIEKEENSFTQKIHTALIEHNLIKKKKKKDGKKEEAKENSDQKELSSKAAGEKSDGKTPKKTGVKLTACSEPSSGEGEGEGEVLVYPEALRYRLGGEADLDLFVREQLVARRPAAALRPAPIGWRRLILVCTHAARDKRCGRAGPQIIDKMREYLESKGIPETEVCVRGSSHIGGHKHAGTLIVYPEGDWYGQISGRNAVQLLENYILAGKRWNKCWRGNMSADLQW